jgi:hypothetical protein
MAKLLVTLPDVGDVAHELSGTQIIVGRTSDNTIQIDEASVALHHARLTPHGRGFRLKDLGSASQTWINGFAITEADVTARCFIRFGNVECVFLPEGKGPAWNDAAEARQEIEAAREAATAANRERDDLAVELARALQQIERISAECEAARMENQNVAALFEEQIKENATITSQRNDAQKRVASLATKNAALAVQLGQISAERDLVRDQHQAATRELSALRAQLEAITGELESVRGENAELLAGSGPPRTPSSRASSPRPLKLAKH